MSVMMRLSEVLFLETRTKALPDSVMVKAISDRLSLELRNRFSDVGIPAVYARVNKEPFDVIRSGVGGNEASDALWFEMHVGLPDGNNIFAQMRFGKMGEIASVAREFAAKRGWVLAAYRPVPNFSPAYFGVYFVMMPDKKTRASVGDMPSYLYHLTDVENIQNIKRSGLKPRAKTSKNRSYPGRVYMFWAKSLLDQMIEQTMEAHKNMADSGDSYHQPLTKTPHMAVVKINPRKLLRGTKFYVDPEFDGEPGAVYTYTHIPPEAISGIEQIG